MAVKKATKVEKETRDEEIKSSGERYFYAIGKRKTAVVQVKITPVEKAGKGISVNGGKIEEYFLLDQLRDIIRSPFIILGQDGKFDTEIKASGGGKSSQADAAKLGISRALVKFDEGFRRVLKSGGFLRRDARVVERKKPGLKKARRSPQWAKR